MQLSRRQINILIFLPVIILLGSLFYFTAAAPPDSKALDKEKQMISDYSSRQQICESYTENVEQKYRLIQGLITAVWKSNKNKTCGTQNQPCLTRWYFNLENRFSSLPVRAYTSFQTPVNMPPFQAGKIYSFCAWYKPSPGGNANDYFVIDHTEMIEMIKPDEL